MRAQKFHLRMYGACLALVFLVMYLVSGCENAPTPRSKPDLVVESPGVNQGTIGPGAPFTFSATVHNDGDGDAPATTLRFYLSTDAAISTDDTEIGTAAVAALATAVSASASVDLAAPADPGTYFYGACVDAVAGEADTTNNCSISVQVTVADAPPPPRKDPDLVVAPPSVSDGQPTAGDSFTLSATVRNDGDGDAPATTLRFYLSTDAAISTDDTEIGTAVVAALATAVSASASVDLAAPADPGTYFYGACVDAVAGEADTTNNCSASVQVEAVSPLSFQGTVADQTYPTGQAITPLVLPAATGGRGSLIYSLRPDIPGLSFDPVQRTLSGTPTEAGSHLMSYAVTDGTDSISSAFTITIEPAGLSSRYRGTGDQVFVLNPDGAMLNAEPYTLDLGNASAEVYLIATNTATYHMDPHIERLDLRGRRAAVQDGYVPPPRSPAASARVPERAWITEFNNNPPLSRRSARAEGARLQTQSQRRVAEGDRFTFRDLDDNRNLVFIPATARKVVTDGDTTVALWVADRDWGPNCRGGWPCMTGEMVDALADRFLRPGAGNDIHDWVTAIYGDPWGSHDLPFLIPPDADDEIHILVFDIRGDGIPAPDECRIVGFFWAVHNFRQGNPEIPPVSAERLIFFMDSVYTAIPEGPSWEVTDLGPSIVISVLAHEFQHMIHFYQKPVLRDTVSATWLNEMASEVAQDLIADKLQVDGPAWRPLPRSFRRRARQPRWRAPPLLQPVQRPPGHRLGQRDRQLRPQLCPRRLPSSHLRWRRPVQRHRAEHRRGRRRDRGGARRGRPRRLVRAGTGRLGGRDPAVGQHRGPGSVSLQHGILEHLARWRRAVSARLDQPVQLPLRADSVRLHRAGLGQPLRPRRPIPALPAHLQRPLPAASLQHVRHPRPQLRLRPAVRQRGGGQPHHHGRQGVMRNHYPPEGSMIIRWA